MSDEKLLRMRARQALEIGKLPHSKPKRMWGGPGSGAPCSICVEPVMTQELGFELEFHEEQTGDGNHHVHLRCFAAWEFERRHFSRPKPSQPMQLSRSDEDRVGPGYASSALSACNNDGTICVKNEGTLAAPKRDDSPRGGAV